MRYFVRKDEEKRPEVILSEDEYSAYDDEGKEFEAVEIEEGFDFDTSRDYVVEGGVLVYSPPPLTEEDEAMIEQAGRYSQMETAMSLFVKSASITDEQALSVSYFYDRWNPTAHYDESDRVRYGDDLWQCREPHDAQATWTPDQAHSLWRKILKPGTVEEWVRPQPGIFDGYEKGDRASYEGKIYESIFDGLNVWGPPNATGMEAYWKKV